MWKTGKVLAALVAYFLLHQLFVSAISTTDLYRLQAKLLHWRYMHQGLFFIVGPAIVFAVLRRKPSDYAICWNRHVLISITAILLLTVVFPMLIDLALGQLRPVKPEFGYLASTLVFQTIFSGCGEELCFRGMYQGEIDRVAKRRFRLGDLQFGPGVFVGAFFFGLGHLGTSSLLKLDSLDYSYFTYACVIGIFLGIVRQFAGSIFIVGFLHASFDTYSYLVTPTTGGQITHFVAIGVVCFLLFNGRLGAEKRDLEAMRELGKS